MREDVNDLLDRAVGWYRSDADPDPARIAKIASRRHRRRRFSAIAVSTVLTLGALAFVVTTLTPGRSGGPPIGTSPTSMQPPTSTDQVIGYHGLTVTVPASWSINDEHCGTPQSDTVIRDTGGVLLCLVPRPPRISSVEMVDNPGYWLPKIQSPRTLTNPNGVQLERGTVPDRDGIAVYVPAVNVLMFVQTVTEAETGAIVDSIRLADTDPNGCAMRERQLEPPVSYQPESSMQDVLIPGSASAIAICHYVDNWLVSSATVTGQEMASLVSVVNELPEGFVHAPPASYEPSQCDEPASEGGELGSGYILWVHEADGIAVPLWAHVGICGDLGITNGARDGQLTPEFAKALNESLHAGYVMPGRLIIGPSSD